AGRELAARQDEHRRAAAALEAWAARRPRRDEAAAELADARRAAPGGALAAALADRSAGAADAERAAAAAVAAARAAGVDPQSDGQLRLGGGSDVADALRGERDRLRGIAGAVEVMVARERALEAEERALDDLQRRRDRHARDAEDRRGEVEAAAAARPAAEAAVEAAREAAARLPGLEDAAARTAAAARAGAARDALVAEVERGAAAHTAAREDAVAAAEAHAVLLRERLDGIAAELAGRLADGEACAVCGSVEHPAPAAAPERGIVTEAQVQAARAAVDQRATTRDRAAEALNEARSRLAAEQAIAGTAPVGDLRAAAEAAAAALTAARTRAAGRAAAERALRDLVAAHEQATSRLRAAEDAAREATVKLTERSDALTREREELEAARDGAPSVAARLERLCRAADAADGAADALDAAARLVAEADQARARATTAARQAGFATVDALRAALRDDARSSELEQLVRGWDEGLAERRAALAREDLRTAVATPAPDLPGLEAAAREAAGLAERTHGELVLAQRRRQALTALRERLAEALAVAGPARERYATAREVADLAAGVSASNRLRMRLSAYVLAARLEEVAAAATVRLAQMSGGRYALEHTDDGAKGRSRGGLDLRVVDAWTGRDRMPASLSGGETFLASLALALGLADVVTAEAGGARLETLFVDEGFGSLDDEGTLDEVLEVLDGLRDGGRAVGIVSHVAEMRQRIPMQLRIEKGRTGSRVLHHTAVA
ncbi:MAG: repair protein SbcC/Rad50, partial [Solirubrobacteraceae bacterium]|nr:repair protein SbcC/Rad50 [Solirubrobacteraceae bacterium]